MSIDKWIQNIKLSAEEEIEIRNWCVRIGYQKYEGFYELLKSQNETITLDKLKEIAIYDLRIRKVLFDILLNVEQYLRAIICNEYGELLFKKITFKDDLIKLADKNEKALSPTFKVNYPLDISDEANLFCILTNSSLNMTAEIVKILPNTLLIKTDYLNQQNEIKMEENLNKLIILRNAAMHHNVLIGTPIKNTNIDECIFAALSFLPTRKLLSKAIYQINKCAEYTDNMCDRKVTNFAISVSKEKQKYLFENLAAKISDKEFLIDDKEVDEIYSLVGVRLEDRENIYRVFTHSSYGNEKAKKHNAAFATRGDAVLKLAFTDILMQRYPDLTKGELTEYKKELEGDKVFAALPISKELFNHLKHRLCNKTQVAIENGASDKRYPTEVFASLFEAVAYAIYDEYGIDEVKKFATISLKNQLLNIERKEAKRNKNDY